LRKKHGFVWGGGANITLVSWGEQAGRGKVWTKHGWGVIEP